MGELSAATYPSWVMLEFDSEREAGNCSLADAKTAAACFSPCGRRIHLSFALEAPPATSRLRFCNSLNGSFYNVVAAHGDSVLIHNTNHYFVYRAGELPSLSLLPPYYLTGHELDERYGRGCRPRGRDDRDRDIPDGRSVGLLCCSGGDDDVVVAELKMPGKLKVPGKPGAYMCATMPDLRLLSLRSGKWRLKQTRIISVHDYEFCWSSELPKWHTDTVVAVGNRWLCWVDLYLGAMFCDVLDESPMLEHVSLPGPVEARPLDQDGEPRLPNSSRNVCVVDSGDGDTLKFVRASPRCCCGDPGTTTDCRRSRHAYTIMTWTLRMDNMEWEMDGMVDATELWALDAYKEMDIPRVPLGYYPVVSMEDPHVIFFYVSDEKLYVGSRDKKVWLIAVDMRSKTLRSASRYPREYSRIVRTKLFPSRLSNYFNFNPNSKNLHDAHVDEAALNMGSKTHLDIQLRLTDDQLQLDDLKSSVQPSCNSLAELPMQVPESASSLSYEEMIFAALEDIPDLALDDMLKAYSLLSHDGNGQRFRSLLGLPVNLRKRWLLMEIKASHACSVCSVCTTAAL